MRDARMLSLVLLSWTLLNTGCGSGWVEAFDASDRGWQMNVWGTSTENVYSVGGSLTRGRIQHFDGEHWEELSPGVEVPLLNWAFGFSAEDVFVVGNDGTVLRWNGESWASQSTPIRAPLWGVWGAAPDDVWAVGGTGTGSGEPVILHFDGAGWTQIALPALTTPNVFALYKVWGLDAQNVWAVGQQGVVLRYDGSAWREEQSGAPDDLISLWGTAADRIVAVGGRAGGIVSVWNGDVWRTESLPGVAGLNGVWMQPGDEPWLVGAEGTIGRLDLEAFAFEEEEIDTALDLHSIFGVEGRLWTVGGDLSRGTSDFRGVAFTREGER